MVLHPLAHAIDMPWFNSFMWGFSHVEWEGFSTWDLVMPLFLFMAGVSMPFSLSRYKDMPDKMAVYRRIGKRVLLLWVFGMMCQKVIYWLWTRTGFICIQILCSRSLWGI